MEAGVEGERDSKDSVIFLIFIFRKGSVYFFLE